ncbi:MAG: DHA2 family efflux MFS transporter permease subunit [Solirubrobacteraceae bacterium]|nr:DHA2 family efflux MFS transporter permease subunit [Solirubrobacteraceae bacterium]
MSSTPSEHGHGAVLALAGGATALAMLDATVANLAIPDLHTSFGGHAFSDLSWVITAYAVAFAALLAPAGRLADALGRRPLFIAGTALFALASLACALAPSLGALVTARAIQGVGAAVMIPASLAIVLTDVPPERRTRAIGVWSAAGALAAAVGPAVGGVVVDGAGWRWLFIINLPMAAALIAVAWTAVPRGAVGGRLPDVVGTLLVAAGVGGVVLGLTQGGDWGWTDPRTIVAVAGGVLAAGAAIRRSMGHPAPALDVSLWRVPSLAFANLAGLAYGVVLYAWLLVGVLFLTDVWGYSELEAGLAMTPGGIMAGIFALGVAPLTGRIGPRPVVIAGGLLLASDGVFLAATLPADPAFLTFWLPGGMVLGAAMGLITTGTSTAAALSAPPERFASATALNVTARQVGGALGVAALAMLLDGHTPGTTGAYADVYVLGAVAALAVAGFGLRLVLPGTAAPPSPALTTAEATS